MAAAHWALPQREEGAEAHLGKRALGPHSSEPWPLQHAHSRWELGSQDSAPKKVTQRLSHMPPALEPCTRKHEDSVCFISDSLGPLTKRCLNSFLFKTRIVGAFAMKQLGEGITFVYK